MSGLFDMTKDERRRFVAIRLGFFEGAPETWPKEVIDRLLANAERTAMRLIDDDVRALGPHYKCSK